MYEEKFNERLEKQKVFFSRKEPGDILIYYRRSGALDGVGFPPYFQVFVMEKLSQTRVEALCNDRESEKLVCNFLEIFRESYKDFYEIDHDALPTIEVFFGIGGFTAAMSGGEAKIAGGTSWCEPGWDSWDEIRKLKFNPHSVWVQFASIMYRALLKYREGDFLLSPFSHRSPLDSATGLRGPTELFFDMHDRPADVRWLLNWCTEWSISLDNYLSENAGTPGVARGVWGTYLPNRTVFVNGDPVDLISRQLEPVFNRPYNEKLFEALGGGFFHHHAIGLHQVDQVALTKDLVIHELYDDPGVPSVAEVIINDKKMRDKILEASLKVPIMLDDFPFELLDPLLPFLAEGRFILRPRIQREDRDAFANITHRIRKSSKI
ncbi:MAG: hypothetical protein FJ009_17660 [Chloroflexi bacterium]|nr:hypothetical protein [Chloroflexota bacterium]